jgi:phosphopantothenoylcysteine decarboxylase/phosphopantothenate--cysteine ligase
VLAGKHILLGISGGIAAYKAPLIVRECIRRGAEVQTLLTPSAREFVTPLTLATLSQREVVVDMFPPDPARGTWHIHLALWADVMLIAPATANTLAKCAHGFADNALTALTLALRSPLVVAPAMDMDMYRHPATQANLAILRDRGVRIIEPESGELASGLEGVGRLPEPGSIVDYLETLLAATRDLEGRRILVTAGPTQEPIDPVRFIGNRSSGKMGFAIAAAARDRGADVTLVAGPAELPTPAGVERIDVRTAEEMHRAVIERFPGCDAAIMAAAVADFTPAMPAERKIKKDSLAGDRLQLELVRTTDILRTLGEGKKEQVVMGFALETENELENAQAKLRSKKADFIILNSARTAGAGFGVDTNIVTILDAEGGEEQTGRLPKERIAHLLLDRVVARLFRTAR